MEQLQPCKFNLSIIKQLTIVLGEMSEALEAYAQYELQDDLTAMQMAKNHFLEELCDVQTAIETLKVHNFNKLEIERMHEYVNRKNYNRGYLDETAIDSPYAGYIGFLLDKKD